MNQTAHPGPNPQEIEVSFFGPGFGESVVIHAGNDEWIVIDSCIDSDSGQPAALVYFNQIGVDPSKAVRLVLATHWHDDHIGGMAELIRQCATAEFACSAAVTRNEFLEVAAVYNSRPLASPGLVGLLPAVRKTLNEAGITIRRLQASTGFVRLRSPIGSTQPVWSIAASPDAVHLT
jgi:glyoxylase-like metal-dependent hydrolase (beta-lactamase superfamily II)